MTGTWVVAAALGVGGVIATAPALAIAGGSYGIFHGLGIVQFKTKATFKGMDQDVLHDQSCWNWSEHPSKIAHDVFVGFYRAVLPNSDGFHSSSHEREEALISINAQVLCVDQILAL